MNLPRQSHKWLIIPIENYVREFYGKFLLAAVAAERGWGTLMAYKGSIRSKLPDANGAILEINMTDGERIERYRQLGWHPCAWDEEGLVYLDGVDYAHRRLNEKALNILDKVFLWGDNQCTDVLNFLGGKADNLSVAGNPRFDLLRPDLRQFYAAKAAGIRKKYGQYLLINTNFGTVNHYFGREYIVKTLRDQGKIKTPKQEAEQAARENHQDRIMQSFINMIPEIRSRFPDHAVVIRPHPSEDFDTWKKAAEGLPRVYMIHEGDVVPWLSGADAVIHNSCTTGLQAYLLGKPVISYMPVASDKYDQYLPNALSDKVQSIEGLIRRIAVSISNPDGSTGESEPKKRGVAHEFIASLEGSWASDRVMDELDKMDIPRQTINQSYFSSFGNTSSKFVRYKKGLKNTLIHIKNSINRGGQNKAATAEKNWQTYTRQRFPTLSLHHVQADLNTLQTITGRFENVQVIHLGNDLVCIYPKEN